MDDPVTLEKPLEEMNNDEIMDEIRYLTIAIRDGIIKAYKQEHSKENARRIASRLLVLLLIFLFGRMAKYLINRMRSIFYKIILRL